MPVEHLRCVGPAFRGIFSRGALDEVNEAIGCIASELVDRRKLLVLLLVDDAIQALAIPRALAREHLPSDQTEAVQVAAPIEI